MKKPVIHRHDFVLFFDVTNGNPNGDPDAGNMPRLDPETMHGLVSDVALKRKVRNYVSVARDDAPGQRIYMSEGATLNHLHKEAWAAIMPGVHQSDELKKPPKDPGKARELTQWMCANFWDIRTFGAVMSTGVNAGQVRGPVQFTFARSVEPVLPQEVTITRMAATTQSDAQTKGSQTMGRKFLVPYGLYRMHGFVSAPLASHPTKGTGFSEADLELLWQALTNMFEHDRSATRGEMTTRKLVVFRHDSKLGNAPAHLLFDRVTTWRIDKGSRVQCDGEAISDLAPARRWSDYQIEVDVNDLPPGVTLVAN